MHESSEPESLPEIVIAGWNFILTMANPSSTHEDMQNAHDALMRAMPAGTGERAAITAAKKQAAERMIPFFKAAAELANEEDPLGPVSSLPQAIAAYRGLVDHCEQLWHDSVRMFHSERFAPALFLALVCIEETAKLAVARIQVPMWDHRQPAPKPPRDLQSHRRKHWLATCAGAVVNSRMDRIFGIDRINEFIALAEAQGLETVRQQALYSDQVGGRQHLPYRDTALEDARFYVAVAGELLAEASDIGDDWQRILDDVSRFEAETGIVSLHEQR